MAELLIRLSQKSQRQKIRSILWLRVSTGAINIAILVIMVILSVNFIKALDIFYGSCDAPYDSPTCDLSPFIRFITTLGWISGSFYTLLTLCLIATYVVLNKQLKQIFDSSVSKEVFKSINLLFGVLVASYTLRTLYSYFEGHYRQVIKSKFGRLEGELILWPLFDFMCLIPILLMHRKNFNYKPKEILV